MADYKGMWSTKPIKDIRNSYCGPLPPSPCSLEAKLNSIYKKYEAKGVVKNSLFM